MDKHYGYDLSEFDTGTHGITIRRSDLARIALSAAEALKDKDTFSTEGIAITREGESVSVWSKKAYASDVLGWIYRIACPILNDHSDHRSRTTRASELISACVLKQFGKSLITINDTDGRIAVIRALISAHNWFNSLPEHYDAYWEPQRR